MFQRERCRLIGSSTAHHRKNVGGVTPSHSLSNGHNGTEAGPNSVQMPTVICVHARCPCEMHDYTDCLMHRVRPEGECTVVVKVLCRSACMTVVDPGVSLAKYALGFSR